MAFNMKSSYKKSQKQSERILSYKPCQYLGSLVTVAYKWLKVTQGMSWT